METEIVPVKEVPKAVVQPQQLDEVPRSDGLDFFHVAGTCDKNGQAMVVVLGSRLATVNTTDVKSLVKYIKENMDQAAKQDYCLLYCHDRRAEKRGFPTIEWLHELYNQFDANYKKNLKKIVVLHPTVELRNAMRGVFQSFISPKVFQKVSYLKFVDQLKTARICAEDLQLPISVYDNDVRQMIVHRRISMEDDLDLVPPRMLISEDPIYKGIKALSKRFRRR